MRLLLLPTIQLILTGSGIAFTVNSKYTAKCNLSIRSSTRLGMFFADDASESVTADEPNKIISPPNVDIVSSDSETFIDSAGEFLVDHFWLNSQHFGISAEDISDSIKRNLVSEQCSDLQDKYGERMGSRMLKGQILSVVDTSNESRECLGLATMKETILMNDSIVESEQAETLLKDTVANLRPKERREYKNASIQKLTSELLPEGSKAIVLFSNLAVAGEARGRGIARYICEEAEALAKEWEYSEIWLVVESENVAAKKLYEDKLGYKIIFEKEGADALRVDTETGEFIEKKVNNLILSKAI